MTVEHTILKLMGEKQARENKRVTEADVAKALGMTRQAFNKIVTGETKSLTYDIIDGLCEYFDCEPGDLLVRVREPQA